MESLEGVAVWTTMMGGGKSFHRNEGMGEMGAGSFKDGMWTPSALFNRETIK